MIESYIKIFDKDINFNNLKTLKKRISKYQEKFISTR